MARTDFDKEDAAALEAAAQSDKSELRAVSAKYDRRSNRIIVQLRNGASFMFPPELAQGLRGAAPKDLSRIEITPSGEGLRWPNLDADFSLPGLMMGVFGNKAWMSEFARRGGSATSKAKAAASRANGRKGGRPRTRAS
ncbi:MAG TPA: DUF2442 domain-containing protein [Blastocatellia bacterium]